MLTDAGACNAHAPLLVGYSGGLDSTVLLHLLAEDPAMRARGLRAIHVHHGLHADADAWALHCRQACSALGVALEVVCVDGRRDTGDGLEAAARAARHGAFAAALRGGETLALAHHLDDQAETFLLRALRASGDGLGAMAPWRPYAAGQLWRPLLDTPRATLLQYARARGLAWIEDTSNDDDIHARNYLRHQVMPLLRSRWPHADHALARSAALQRASDALHEAADAQALATVRGVDPACLDATKLRRLPAARRARVLRRWAVACGLPPLPAAGVTAIERDLLHGDGKEDGRIAEFAWRDAVVRRWRDLLWAGRRQPALDDGFRAEWRDGRDFILPGGDRLSLAGDGTPPAEGWIVHARRGGERITLPGRSHSHAVKQVLQALGIPPWQRTRLPLLSSPDGTLLAMGDVVVSAAFDRWARAHRTRLYWHPATP